MLGCIISIGWPAGLYNQHQMALPNLLLLSALPGLHARQEGGREGKGLQVTPCPARQTLPTSKWMELHGDGCRHSLPLLLLYFSYCWAVAQLHLSSQDQGCCCRHRAHKAGALKGSEGVAPSSRGAHAKASSSSGRAYTSSGGLPPQLPHTCHSCGVEVGGASRYSILQQHLAMESIRADRTSCGILA